MTDVRAAYHRKLVDNILQHKTCYPSRCFKGKNVVSYNPEIAILWGAADNVQVVSKHGFYLLGQVHLQTRED